MSLAEYGIKTDTQRAILTVTFDYSGNAEAPVNINIAGYGEKELPMVLQGVFYDLAEHVAKYITKLGGSTDEHSA